MGKSVTCTFQVEVKTADNVNPIYGAMTLKDAKGVFLSEKEYREENKKPLPVGALIWAQTARGRKMVKQFDYLYFDGATGKIEGKYIS